MPTQTEVPVKKSAPADEKSVKSPKKLIGDCVNAVAAGFFISLGATIFLQLKNTSPVAAAVYFSLGIMLVGIYNNGLVTRLIPLYAAGSPDKYKLTDILLAYVGNGAGAVLTALALTLTRSAPSLSETNAAVVAVKLGDSYVSLFFMAAFCAVMVGCSVMLPIAGDAAANPVTRLVYVALLISGFVIMGFEHIVADFYYIALAAMNGGVDAGKAALLLTVVTLGNIAGGTLAGGVFRIRKKLAEQ